MTGIPNNGMPNDGIPNNGMSSVTVRNTQHREYPTAGMPNDGIPNNGMLGIPCYSNVGCSNVIHKANSRTAHNRYNFAISPELKLPIMKPLGSSFFASCIEHWNLLPDSTRVGAIKLLFPGCIW